jgi:alkyl-hydroperoxide reductase/thiol specific antioxidant family protein
VLIGNGTAAMARSFREEFNVSSRLLTDPDRRAYAALGLPRGVSLTATFKTVKSGLRAMKRGYRQGAVAGDPWQLGGVLLTDRAGLVHYRRASQFAGDHPDPEELLAAVRELSATTAQSG